MTTDERLERKARREYREWKALGALKRLGVRVERPDFSKCDNASECEWVSLGGKLSDRRAIFGEDDAASIEACASLEARLTGDTRSLAADDKLSERSVDRGGDEPEGMDPEVADVLRRLGLPVEFSKCRTETEYQAAKAAKRESGAGK